MRLTLKVVMQSDGDFVDVILLYIGPLIQFIRAFVISGSYTCWFSEMEKLHIYGLSQRWAAGRKSVCIWKVLRSSRSITVFRGFPQS